MTTKVSEINIKPQTNKQTNQQKNNFLQNKIIVPFPKLVVTKPFYKMHHGTTNTTSTIFLIT